MKLYNKLKNTLKYGDIETLEYYQSFIMILVNPFNLLPLSSIYRHGLYMTSLAILSIFIGFATLLYSVIGELKIRLIIAEIHWIFCMSVVFMLLTISNHTSNGIISFYTIQLIFSLFCYWRLKRESMSRCGR